MMPKFWISVLFIFLTSCVQNNPTHEIQIQNAQNELICLQLDEQEDAVDKKLAVIQHGLASNMEHPAVQATKKAFLDKGYSVITFDNRNSLGKSDGQVTDGRLSTYEEDLNTVVNWAKTQDFYGRPFVLAGHSLGGASVLRYAAEHPDEVESLILITPVVSGQKWEESCMANMPDFCRKWKEKGEYEYRNAVIPYAVLEEAKSYDALKFASKIQSDVLLITSDNDRVIAPKDVKELNQAFIVPQKLEVIEHAGHNFIGTQNQQDLYQSVIRFLR